MSGLRGVRATARGIQIRWQVGGRSFSRFIAKAPTEAALADAARLRRRLIEESKLGPGEVIERITFEEACRAFLTDISITRAPSTARTYWRRLEARWSALKDAYVQEITIAQLRAVDREQTWLSQKTRRDAQSVLAGVLQWCVSEGYIENNPARALSAGPCPPREIDPFTPVELSAILRELRGQPQLLYMLMSQTGLRTGEVRALQWSDVEPDALSVQATLWKGMRRSTKTHQSRRVLLTSAARQLLKEHTATRFVGTWVFATQHGNPYSEEHLTDAWTAACSAAGVRYRRPYTLRHTYAARALAAGVEVAWLAEQLGDRLETVLRQYARWIGAADRDARELAKLEEWTKRSQET